jgi:hypothetical protein
MTIAAPYAWMKLGKLASGNGAASGFFVTMPTAAAWSSIGHVQLLGRGEIGWRRRRLAKELARARKGVVILLPEYKWTYEIQDVCIYTEGRV